MGERWFFTGRHAWVAALVGLAALAIATMGWRQQLTEAAAERASVLAQANVRALQLADATRSQVDALLRLSDFALRTLRREWLDNRTAFDKAVADVATTFPQTSLVHVAVIGADGYVQYSTKGVDGRVYAGDREHFKVHARGGHDQLHMTDLLYGRVSKEWTVLLSRRIEEGGQFRGVMIVGLSPTYLSQELAKVTLSPDDVVVLVNAQGRFLARSPAPEQALGKGVAADRPFLQPDAPWEGTFTAPASLDQKPRLFGWAKLGDPTVIVAVGLDVERLMASTEAGIQERRRTTVLTIAIIVVAGLGLALMVLYGGSQQAALERSTARLRQAQKLAQIGDWEFDLQACRLHWSDEVFRIFGVDPARFDGTHQAFIDCVHPDDRAAVQQAYERTIQAREPFVYTHRIVLPDGRIKHVEERCTTDYDVHGKALRSVGTVQDVTAMHEAQAQRESAYHLLRSIIDAVPVRIFWKDRDLVYQGCNAPMAADGQFKHPDVIIGKTDYDLIPAEWAREFQAVDRAIMASGVPKLDYDEEVLMANGTLRWLRTSKVPMLSTDGREVIGILGLYQDVTPAKQTEHALAASEAQFKAIIAAMPVPLTVLDEQGRFTYFNPEFQRVFGYEPQDIPTLDAWWPLAYPDTDARARLQSEWNGRIATALSTGQAFEPMEATIQCKNGRKVTVIGSMVPLSGRAEGSQLVTLFDITERRAATLALEQQQARLEELVEARSQEILALNRQLADRAQAAEAANVAKSAFLANMSHEIRTPLNAIVGMAHLVERAGLSPQQQDRMTKLRRASEHLVGIIDAILELSKIEAGKMSLEVRDLRLAEVFGSVTSMLQHKALEKNLGWVVQIPSLPWALQGDAVRLQQCLTNYASNAIKFTSVGQISLRATVVDQNEASVLLRFEVEDTGIGIDAQVIPRLFSIFEQADNSTTRRYGGTGLGLAITRRFAEMMDGTVGVDSVVGRGSCFWFTARLRIGAAVPAPSRVAAPPLTLLAQQFAGARILLVEDEPINREITTLILQDAHLQVDEAHDGEQAIAMARAGHYALILMDLQMPGTDGLEATRAIRTLPAYHRIPIIAMTANAFKEDRERCTAAGMNDFLSKPVRPKDLYAALAHWLDLARSTTP